MSRKLSNGDFGAHVVKLTGSRTQKVQHFSPLEETMSHPIITPDSVRHSFTLISHLVTHLQSRCFPRRFPNKIL